MSAPCRIGFALMACISTAVALANLVACDEPASAGGPPKIFSFIAPTLVDAGAVVPLEAKVNGNADLPLTVKWQVAGPGEISASEYQVTAPDRIASGELSNQFQAPASPARTTVQLTLENGAGFDQAQVTIQTGYEAPYLSTLKVIDATGQARPIDVPELAAPVLVYPGDQFSLVAEAIDYNGLPLSYSWWFSNDFSATDDCSSAGSPFDFISGTDGPQVTLIAPKLFCSTQLTLSISDGKSTWQSPVATLRVGALPPKVKSITAPSSVGPGQTIALSADVTYDPTTSIDYDWSLFDGDGKSQGSSSEATASFALLDQAQSYTACLAVTDGYGQKDSNCINLVVPSDWQLEGTLSPTSYINVPSANYVDSIAIKDAIILERFDRTTQQTSVVNAIPNIGGRTYDGLFCVTGEYFGVADLSSTILRRLDVTSLSTIAIPNHLALFVAAGKLWELGVDASNVYNWQYLATDAWQAGGQSDQLTTSGVGGLQAVVGRDDGRFLVLFSGASLSVLFECNVAGGCQSLGTLQASIDPHASPMAMGWTTDGRAVVLQGLKAWRHDPSGWVLFSRTSLGIPSAVPAIGEGQACHVAPDVYGLYNWSVWCLGAQGWGLIGLANIVRSCSNVALAVTQDTAYFACDGKLYSHSLALP